jgi:hypothetical protein
VIDRSALQQAREGSGGRDIEEPLIGLGVQKSTLEDVTAVRHCAIPSLCSIYKTGGWRQIKIRAPAATFDGILIADFERHTATQEFECVIFKMVKLLPRK